MTVEREGLWGTPEAAQHAAVPERLCHDLRKSASSFVEGDSLAAPHPLSSPEGTPPCLVIAPLSSPEG